MRTFLHTTLFWSYLVLGLAPFFAIAVVVWLLTLPFDPNGRVLHYFTCFWSGHIVWLNPMWRLKIVGRQHVKKGEAYIFASNHQSAGDVAVLFATFLPFKFVSKRENFIVPFIGWNMYLNRYIKVDRGNFVSARKLFATCKRWFDRKVSVLMFPEGTRSRDGRMLEFKLGTFLLAKESGTKIIPIVLDNTLEGLPRSGILDQKSAFDVRVSLGAPIDPAGYPNARSLARAVRARMEEMQRESWRLRDYAGPPLGAASTTGERAVSHSQNTENVESLSA